MPNYAVTTTTFGPDDVATVAAAMEVAIQAVDTAKTIRLYTVIGCARDSEVIGVLVVDT